MRLRTGGTHFRVRGVAAALRQILSRFIGDSASRPGRKERRRSPMKREGKRQRMGRTRNNFRLLAFATVVVSGHATVRLTGTGSAGRYGGGWRVQITSPQVASRLVGAEHADVGSDGVTSEPAVWACVDREPCEGGKLTDRFEPQIKEGLPDAVARLRPQRALIDQLCLSIPQVELVDP